MVKTNIAEIGFKREMWKAADLLRGNIDAVKYKSEALGLIFLKYISNRFEARLPAVAHHTVAEIIYNCTNAEMTHIGLTTWKKAPVRQRSITVRTFVIRNKELKRLKEKGLFNNENK